MDALKRITDYDLFAYVPQGAMAIVLFEYVVGTTVFLHREWTIAEGLLFFVLAYIGGHIISSPSSFLVERLITRKWVGGPIQYLLSNSPPSQASKLLLGHYSSNINHSLKTKIEEKLSAHNISGISDDSLYWIAYPIARQDDRSHSRLQSFLNLYGFCRNTSFILGVSSISLVIKSTLPWEKATGRTLELAVVCAASSFMLFYRYLKFYRAYALEVLVAYSVSNVTPPPRPGRASGSTRPTP